MLLLTQVNHILLQHQELKTYLVKLVEVHFLANLQRMASAVASKVRLQKQEARPSPLALEVALASLVAGTKASALVILSPRHLEPVLKPVLEPQMVLFPLNLLS